MTRKEITDKLESVDREVKEIKEYLSQNEKGTVEHISFPLAIEPDFELGYTLEDLYREFGSKKS